MWTHQKLTQVNHQLTSAKAVIHAVQDEAEDDSEEMAGQMYRIGEYLDDELEGLKEWFSPRRSILELIR